jgi:hypothetical protein
LPSFLMIVRHGSGLIDGRERYGNCIGPFN